MTKREVLDSGMLHEPKVLDTLTIIYRDVFHMKGLYEMMHDWLVEYGYKDNNGDDGDAFEAFYWERRKPGTSAKDFNIWWRLKKEISPWWTYFLNVDFVGIHIGNTEVMHEGKKVKLNDGELDLFITPYYVLDYNKMWKGGTIFDPFLRPLRLRMIKKDFSWHKKEMEEDARKLQMLVKDYFDLKQFMHRGENFHPKKGLGWD